MKTIGTIVALLFTIHFSASAQDSLKTAPTNIKDKIYVHGEGSYEGVITYDDKKDSITIVTDKGATTFKYGEVDKIEYNIARAKRESQMYNKNAANDQPHMQPYARAPRLVTKEYLTRMRNVSIILSSIGGGLHALGFGLLNASERTYDPKKSIGLVIGGSLVITAGTGVAIGSIPTWIIYAVKRNKYKRQQEQRQF